jgi:single-strand DNA-binding protein
MSATIIIEGRLGADPELRITTSGASIASLRVVSNGRRKTEQGTWEDVDTTWWSVKAFAKTAEGAVEQLRKGDLVAIVGRAAERSWKGADGETRTRIEVAADTIAKVVRAKPIAQSDPWNGGTTSDEAPF